MSLPKVDPNYTIRELEQEGMLFLEAGLRYFEARHKAGMSGAVVWFKNSENGMVIFTRGEYSQQIVNNIEAQGSIYQFGGMHDVS